MALGVAASATCAFADDVGQIIQIQTITPLFSGKAEGFRGQRKRASFPEGTNLLALESG